MSSTTLKTPRADQPAALQTIPSPLPPSDGRKTTNTVRMTRAEWAATPRDYKLFSRKTGRFVMRHSPHGIGLFPVQIID